MDDKDYVFARFKSDKPSADRRETLTIARRGSAAGVRSIEVVHVRSGMADIGKPRRTDTQVRAASWEGGFPARQAAPPPLLPKPVPTEAPEPVAHDMPPLAPTLLTVEADRSVEPASSRLPVEDAILAPRTISKAKRRVADPFDPNDDGANCLRCGYSLKVIPEIAQFEAVQVGQRFMIAPPQVQSLIEQAEPLGGTSLGQRLGVQLKTFGFVHQAFRRRGCPHRATAGSPSRYR